MPQLTLPLARASDPRTSKTAAASVGRGLEPLILQALVGTDGLTDDELCDRIDAYGPSIKTARSRLLRQRLVEDTGRTRKSKRGRASIVWKIV